MESYLLTWLELLLRWVHIVTAIAWVGSSFYFVFLDNNLLRPSAQDLKDKGVDGALWAVHGGGFYNPQKYMVAPNAKAIDSKLHWFYWESYSTWLSGFALFTITYLWNATAYLVDKSRMDWSASAAIAVALAFMLLFWLLYDAICKWVGQRKNAEAIVGALVLLLVCVASWLACQWFAGRAAFLLVGAMIATAMSANVFFCIIPGQKKVVAAMNAGQPIDPVHGVRGKQRSVHNTYFTLPVLFAMISTHYSFTYSHPHNWLVLILMMIAGAAIRQYFVMRHGFKLGRNANPWPHALAGVAMIFAVIVWLAPAPAAPSNAGNTTSATIPATVPAATAATIAQPSTSARMSDVQRVLEARCTSCHGANVQMKNLRLDASAQVQQHAQAIYNQVVHTRLMPLGNSTGMSEAERDTIARWFLAGAKAQ